ncbi:MAG: GTPase domain-containing protein [Anaerolineae bacterium]|nr:GTPase domain-containing protein [Anaerolineae bacterium]
MYINWKLRELDIKIVYYGPPCSGKTTNLEQIHARVAGKQQAKLVSLKTQGDRTLFFDFLPLEIGECKGLKPRINLYTVPGQGIYTSTRRVVLEEVDGLVFVADSQRSRLYENVQAMHEMKEHLRALGYRPQDVPLVLQFNKRDLSYLSSVTTLQYRLAPSNNIPYFEAAATQGTGIIATLKQIVNLVLAKV